jgi:hypothetical protein
MALVGSNLSPDGKNKTKQNKTKTQAKKELEIEQVQFFTLHTVGEICTFRGLFSDSYICYVIFVIYYNKNIVNICPDTATPFFSVLNFPPLLETTYLRFYFRFVKGSGTCEQSTAFPTCYFSFFEELHTVFHTGSANLHFY